MGFIIMGCGAVGGCDVNQDSRHLGPYHKLECLGNGRLSLTIFDARHVDCNKIKHFAFCAFFT